MYKKVWIFLVGVAVGQEMMYRHDTGKSIVGEFVQKLKQTYNAE